MDRLLFGLLGPTTVISEAGEVAIQGTMRRRLLARLLVARGRPVPAGRLREDLWDGDPPDGAASTLKSHVSLLRRVLGPARLENRGGGYVLVVGPGELDVSEFENDVARGLKMIRAGDPAAAVEAYQRALAMWRGRALEEVADAAWARPEAVRLEELRAGALDGWLGARLALGETHEVVSAAEAAVAEHPLREQLWAKLITALYRSGRQTEALRAYQRLRRLLDDELGIRPSPELAELESSILRQEPHLSSSVEHSDPDHRSQLGNLPLEVTSFVARPTEMADIQRWFQQPCLLSLVGPGGIGKTRMAIEAARQGSSSMDSVWLCELSGLSDASDVVRELGLVLGCADHAGVELIDLVTRRLSDGRQLLILDNCEHLLDECAAVAARLRREAPELRLVATSRAPLEAPGEVVYRVPPLSTPGIGGATPGIGGATPGIGGATPGIGGATPGTGSHAEDLLGYESIRLFVERGGYQRAGFTLDAVTGPAVAGICRRLDGMPLAIELAAARLRTMSVADIERGLDDRFRLLTGGARTAPARQRTLRALVDWSYDLLSDPERHLFERLSVFATSFDLEAAEAVGLAVVEYTADCLASLVDKSLVQFELSGRGSRYRMLETIREYAIGRIAPQEELDARRAHAAYFGELALRAMPHLTSADHVSWRSRLEDDDENLRAAFVTSLSEGRPADLLEFAAALCRYWISRGSYGDEMALIESALDRTDAGDATPARGEALAAAAFMYFRRGENTRAEERLGEALRIAEQLGLPALAADALRTSAWVADRRGEADTAAQRAGEAVEMALRSGKPFLIARAYDVRAASAQERHPEQARADYRESLHYSRVADDVAAQASTLNNLAILELEQGDHRAARRHFDEALAIAEGMADPALLPFIRYGAGLTSLLDGDAAAAWPALAESLSEARRTGQRSLEAYALLAIVVSRVRSEPDLAAAKLLGAALGMFERLGERPEPTEAALCAQAVGTLDATLGEVAHDAVESGRVLVDAEVRRLAAEPCPPTAGVIQ